MVLDPLISSQFSVHSKVMALIIWPYLCSWLSWQKLSFKLNPEQRHQYYWDSCCPKMPRRLTNHSWKKVVILEPGSFFQAKFDRFGKILVASKKRRKKVLIWQQQLVLFLIWDFIILKVSQLSHNFSSFLNRDKIENLPKKLGTPVFMIWNQQLVAFLLLSDSVHHTTIKCFTHQQSLYNFVCQFWNHIHIVCILYL